MKYVKMPTSDSYREPQPGQGSAVSLQLMAVGRRHCRVLYIAILNHLRNYCRGNPPVVAPIDMG
jgi:hypothetical protein